VKPLADEYDVIIVGGGSNHSKTAKRHGPDTRQSHSGAPPWVCILSMTPDWEREFVGAHQ